MSEPKWLKLSLEASSAIVLAESDPKQALEVLRIASIYLIHKKSLPHDLSDFLASAFLVASSKSDVENAKQALWEELGLKALNKRPKVITALELHTELFNKSDRRNVTTRVKRAAEKFDVSDSYIWKLKKKYQKEFEEMERLCEEFSREHFQVYRELKARLERIHKQDS